MRGTAVVIMESLSDVNNGNCEALLTVLESGFSSPQPAGLYHAELSILPHQPPQSLPELVAQVERLAREICKAPSSYYASLVGKITFSDAVGSPG